MVAVAWQQIEEGEALVSLFMQACWPCWVSANGPRLNIKGVPHVAQWLRACTYGDVHGVYIFLCRRDEGLLYER